MRCGLVFGDKRAKWFIQVNCNAKTRLYPALFSLINGVGDFICDHTPTDNWMHARVTVEGLLGCTVYVGLHGDAVGHVAVDVGLPPMSVHERNELLDVMTPSVQSLLSRIGEQIRSLSPEV